MPDHKQAPRLGWAYLIHLSYNMWNDRVVPPPSVPRLDVKPYLRFEDPIWDQVLELMAQAGVTMVVLDLGDGVQYESHPEIAVQNAWPRTRLRTELDRMRAKGIEPIPKMNFSTSHDVWLGTYARQVSTPPYYAVCRDLIAEAIDLFDGPRLFHLGMDEESAKHQAYCEYVVVRQHDLWWHDLAFLIETVESNGARPWIWADSIWHHPEAFAHRMPKQVLQSNWYYEEEFAPEIPEVKGYHDLEALGFDQVPCGGNYSFADNFEKTVAYCRDVISTPHLKGFLQTTWAPLQADYLAQHTAALEQLGRAREMWQKGTRQT